MAAKGIFVTGTDTGIGKTVISCGLLHGLQARGHRIAAMKPVAAGCERTPQGLRNEDALAMQAIVGGRFSYEQINPCALEPAIAPHLAAAEAKLTIDIPPLVAAYRHLAAAADYIVVEGAGGWRVPLGPDSDMSDLATALELPVLLVVGVRLGCLNHALLTAEAIRADGRPLLGWVANLLVPEAERAQAQVQTLCSRLPAPLLGVVPQQEVPLPGAVAAAMDLSQLLNVLN